MSRADHAEAEGWRAENIFHDWCTQEWRPEWDSRLAKLDTDKMSRERAVRTLRVAEELLKRQVRKRMSIYETVAREGQSWGMFSKSLLDDFQRRIMRTADAALGALKGRLQRNAIAVGYPLSALQDERGWDHLHGTILLIVNNKLRLLEVEGDARADASTKPAASAAHCTFTASSERPPELWNVRLQKARERTKLSRGEVAIRLNGRDGAVTAEAIKKHEEGKAKPKPATRKAYAEIYGISEHAIFLPEISPPQS